MSMHYAPAAAQHHLNGIMVADIMSLVEKLRQIHSPAKLGGDNTF